MNMPQERRKRPVVVLHGAKAARGDFAAVTRLLASFGFDVLAVDYPGYRGWRGLLRVVMPLRTVPLLAMAMLSTLAVAAEFGVWPWATALASLTSAPLVLVIASTHKRRLQSAVAEIEAKLGQTKGWRIGFHALAHSFGTVALHELVARRGSAGTSWPLLERVVLSASVLRRSAPFEWLLSKQVRALRNEYSSADRVVVLAQRLARPTRWLGLTSRLGGLGCEGMSCVQGASHCIHGARLPCSQCIEDEHPLHDVDCSPCGHDGLLRDREHLARVVVPFFLGLEPGRFSAFLDRCLAYSRGSIHEKEVALPVVAAERWGHYKGVTLQDLVMRELEGQPNMQIPVSENDVVLALHDLIELVASVWKDLMASGPELRDASRIDPREAVRYVVAR